MFAKCGTTFVQFVAPIFCQCQDIFKSTFKQQFFGNNFYLKLRTMDLLYAFFLKQAFLETSVHILFFVLKSGKLQKNLKKNHENPISSFARVAVK